MKYASFMRMSIHQLFLAFLFCYLFCQLQHVTADMVLPGCQSKCGDMEIPYPFGIKKGCYLEEAFEVICNTTSHYAYLPWIDADIDFISVQDHIVRVPEREFVAVSFNKSSGESWNSDHYFNITFTSDRFGISPSRNNFIAVGCDFCAYIVDSKSREFLGGCVSFCNRTDIAPKAPSSCSGIGCCQIKFPENVGDIRLWVDTMNPVTRSWADNYCGYFGIVDNRYPSIDKNEFAHCDKSHKTHVHPLIVDWAIGNTSCEDARKGKDYGCGENADCLTNNRGSGYRCRCTSGYEGNPYISNGCKDINECESPLGDKCRRSRCINTPGSYYCLPYRQEKMNFLAVLGTSLAIALPVLVVVCYWIYRKIKKIKEKKLRNKFFKRNGGLLLQRQMSLSSGSRVHESILFKKEDLEKATDNFSESRFLGKGGLGTVYKGMLSSGSIVAIKVSNVVDESQVGQFINEVFILSQINHRHIVKLLGCCLETEVPLLVYEYVCNGTLYHHLHDASNYSVISWEIRLRIAAEVAGAIAYLHSCASPAVFHRDIKSSNILLGENYRAVVSDFGLSRSISVDKTHLTTLVGGTFGYLDPEYFRSGQLNDKSDVYAFGVVLAELLTGRKAISSDKDDEGLVRCFQNALKQNHLLQILDKIVVDEGPNEEIYAVAEICRRCSRLNSRKRPSMKDVAAELDRIRTKEQLKHQESFQDELSSIRERCNSCSTDNSETEKDPTMTE